MESAADEGTFRVQQDRDSQFILSLSCLLSSIETSATKEDDNNIIDKKTNADASAVVVSADNNDEEAENHQSIMIDRMGKHSDTSDGGGDHKAKFQQFSAPTRQKVPVVSLCGLLPPCMTSHKMNTTGQWLHMCHCILIWHGRLLRYPKQKMVCLDAIKKPRVTRVIRCSKLSAITREGSTILQTAMTRQKLPAVLFTKSNPVVGPFSALAKNCKFGW